ncbi:MAG: AraC family transcriptional regulator [Rikenellaceae bacterium]|nr:AraC family transcriptional regulator [Rikenellaceae bacterium]
MFGYPLHLVLEMLLDLIMAILGIILIVKAQDNHLRQIWGVMVVVLAASMLYDNSLWLTREQDILGHNLTLLSLPIMLKWYLFVHTLSLFTIGSLKPSWLTPVRITLLSLPLLLSTVVVLCYYWFNGQITPLGSAADILTDLGRPDVQVRIALFLFTLVTPALNIMLPLIGKRQPARKLSSGMYIYIGCFLLLVFAYILFVIDVRPWEIRTFGFIVAILPSALSVMYLRNENPLSRPYRTVKAPDKADAEYVPEEAGYTLAYRLYERITEHMQKRTPFTEPDYALDNLTADLGTSRTLTTQAIKCGGYTGFREYVNFLRLEHFKQLAATLPGATIKELMFRCGFTSRSSFYRHFAEQESMSPREYLDKLYNGHAPASRSPHEGDTRPAPSPARPAPKQPGQ